MYVRYQPAASATSTIRNARLRYGGRNGVATILLDHNDGTIALEDVTIQDGAGEGVEAAGGATDQGFALSNCSIAGTADVSVRLANNATVHGSVTSCSLEGLVYDGDNAGTVTWTNNAFTNWGDLPSVAKADDVGNLTSNNTFSGTVPQLRVLGGNVARDATWPRRRARSCRSET